MKSTQENLDAFHALLEATSSVPLRVAIETYASDPPRTQSLLVQRAVERLRNDAGEPRCAPVTKVRVNVASPHDDIPAAADGVGLVRTEIVFAGRRMARSESSCSLTRRWPSTWLARSRATIGGSAAWRR